MTTQYSSLAACYDKLNSHINYEEWADFLAAQMKNNGVPDGALVLDLACGTGNITLPLLRRGFDMIATDISPDMLNEARKKDGAGNVLWLLQDMRSFELYGTVGAVVCCLDSINYLTGKIGLRKCFSLVHNYLDPGGVFIFDMNTPYKFRTVYGDNHYILEADGVYCGWKNHYDEKSGLCDFELSIFSEHNGEYIRRDELQRERCWSPSTVSSLLRAVGFEITDTVSDFGMNKPAEDTERIFFICKAIK